MLKIKKMFKNQQGFTLVELLVVIAVIAILAAVVTPNVFKAVDKSKVSATIAEYDAIKTAVITYHADTSMWPAAGGDLVSLTSANKDNNGRVVDSWDGPYLDRFPKENAWGGKIELLEVGSTTVNTSANINIGDIVIKLDNLPDDTIADSLEKQLDKSDNNAISGIVRYVSNDKETVYLVINDNSN